MTGSSAFAGKTLTGIQKVEALETLAKQKHVFCKDLPAFLYGTWKASSLKEGSLAKVTCQRNAEHEGCSTMVCDTNGQWKFHECKWNRTSCYAGTGLIYSTDGLRAYGEFNGHKMAHVVMSSNVQPGFANIVAIFTSLLLVIFG